MKTTVKSMLSGLFINVLIATSLSNAQATVNAEDTGVQLSSPVKEAGSFATKMYFSPAWKLHLIIAITRPERIVIMLRGKRNAVLYQEIVRKGARGYHRKFDFEEMEPGVYQFEISDERQTVVRQVMIVEMPAIHSQRYITYDPRPAQ